MSVVLSILIPFHNAEKTIGRTLDSLKMIPADHRPSAQVILVDDGSTDGSHDLAAAAEANLPGFRWAHLQQSNRGLASARNTGMAQAKGDWLFFLDADDELHANPLEALARHPDASAVLFPILYRSMGGSDALFKAPKLRDSRLMDRFTAGNPLTVSSLVFRRSAVSAPFDESLRSLEDWNFWFDHLAVFDNVVYEKEVIAIIHLHDRNMSRDLSAAGVARRRIALRILSERGDRLSRRQRNNLLIHCQIGALLNDPKPGWRCLFCWPCSIALYAKLLVFTWFGSDVPAMFRRYR